ncbi:Nitrous oxide reductase maturation protein NosR [hydrothermal vent metagenome]|uniref:Nitrous oxide reductase maturation protein NosR n=1 Tax=hydrothermal vent metagenome TaxID=652676 RepID=A0A3B1BLH6_9ZZZZ
MKQFYRYIFSLVLLFLFSLTNVMAVNIDIKVDKKALYARYFPTADSFKAAAKKPKIVSAYKGDKLLGYIFQTGELAPIPAYSGKPIDILMGLNLKGVMTGAKVTEHHEPILLVGIPESSLDTFARQYVGKSVTDRIKVGSGNKKGYVNIDAITGATVSSMVINQTISRASRKVAISKGIIKDSAAQTMRAEILMDKFKKEDWPSLVGDGSVRELHLTVADVDKAFVGTKGEGVKDIGCYGDEAEKNCNEFIDLYYTLLTVPTIGRNLLGDSQYKWLMGELKPGDYAIALMANGLFSFRGNGFVRGGIFDRVQLQQNGNIITFRDLDYFRLNDVYAKKMPDFSEMAIFIIRAGNQFDPGSSWQLELLVRRQTGPLHSVFTSFFADYQLPEKYFTRPAPPPEAEEVPLWVTVWLQRKVEIIILLVALAILTIVLLFQDILVKRPVFLERFRTGFTLFAIFFIGYYTLAQLSIVNVLTFVQALMHEFRWQTFLIDPLIFIIWAYVAMSLLLWGRGIFCGWLCPYGGMQELINKIARHFNVRQWEFPDAVHERMWALKYMILLGLFAVSLQSLSQAERLAEIEPFKTAITLHFVRDWGYVLYAAGLLLISIVNRKFYCKYLCPLGAALVIPGKWQLFNWLKRRKECGKPCQICANECEIRAIDKNGVINTNECHYCLDCQITYFDEHKCPPLIKKRKRKEKANVVLSKDIKKRLAETKA